MKSFGNRSNDKARLRRVLRVLANIVSNPVMANYTPSGPGSLPTGQSAMAGRVGPYIGQERCDATRPPEHTRPSAMEFAVPLRQVLWI